MKTLRNLFILSLAGITASVLFTASSGGRAFAANSGNTGAPGESQTCRSCHGTGFGTTVSLTVKDNSGFPVIEYTPGQSYEVEVSVNTTQGNPARYGFQMLTLKSGNAQYNAWSNPSINTRIDAISNGRSYAEHKGTSISNLFTVDWTAPAVGTGNITFYAGGAAVNSNRGTSGDGGNTTSFVLPESTSTGLANEEANASFTFFPNPANDWVQIKSEGVQSIQVFNITGQVLKSEDYKGKAGQQYQINVADLAAGTYFVQVNLKGGTKQIKKLIVR